MTEKTADKNGTACCRCNCWRLMACIAMRSRNGAEVMVGRCRFYPPKAGHGWPLTEEFDFCREGFEPKTDGGDDGESKEGQR